MVESHWLVFLCYRKTYTIRRYQIIMKCTPYIIQNKVSEVSKKIYLTSVDSESLERILITLYISYKLF